jgi:imidazolonepropionase-like amidohydrolase
VRHRISVLALFLGLQFAPVAQSAEPPAGPTAAPLLISNVRIFDGRNPRLSEPMHVLIEGGKIAKISKAPINGAAAAMVVDAGGRTLMPGLIDNHVHVFMGASSQQDMLNPKIEEATLLASAIEEARLMLLRGFTSVRDLGGPVFALKPPSTRANRPARVSTPAVR